MRERMEKIRVVSDDAGGRLVSVCVERHTLTPPGLLSLRGLEQIDSFKCLLDSAGRLTCLPPR